MKTLRKRTIHLRKKEFCHQHTSGLRCCINSSLGLQFAVQNSDLPTHSYMHQCMLSRSVMSNSLWSHGLQPGRLFCPWDFPSKNTRAGYHFLLQGIFLTPGIKLASLVFCLGRQILYHRATWEATTTWDNALKSISLSLSHVFDYLSTDT